MNVQTLKNGAVNFIEKPFKYEELLMPISEVIALSQKDKLKKMRPGSLKALVLLLHQENLKY
jgi:FixJ family two-component response regulator